MAPTDFNVTKWRVFSFFLSFQVVVLDALQDMEEKRILCFKDALRKIMVGFGH
jgi:hypothetical protein